MQLRATGHLPDAEATVAAGERLGRLLRAGQIVTLTGELGAGKTTLCRGIARGLGVRDLTQVTSPTYALMHEYVAPATLIVHIDAYRLSAASQAIELGLEEAWLRKDAVVVIEWAERLGELLPPVDVAVTLEPAGPDDNLGRTLAVVGPQKLCDQLGLRVDA